jgi:hypothetical protein
MRLKIIILFLFLLIVVFRPCLNCTIAQDNKARLDKIYSAALFYIIKFCKFESIQDSEINICFNGSPTESFKTTFNNKSINGKNILLESSIDSKCDLIYYSNTNQLPTNNELQKFPDSITVSDSSDFLEKGGFIQLGEENNKLKIFLNSQKIDAIKKVVSSDLLAIAEIK